MERKGFIGGSDVHNLFSLKPYGCAVKLWYEKTGKKPDFPESYNPNIERGKALEPIIRKLYEEESGEDIVVPSKQFQHKEYPFLRAFLDGLMFSDTDTPHVIEIKCLNRDSFYKARREGLLDAYILQMQHYLMVTGYQWGRFVIFWADGWALDDFKVERNQELIDKMLAAELRFWKFVENGPKPDPLELGDKRCGKCLYRVSCHGKKLQDLYDLQQEEHEYKNLSDSEDYQMAAEKYITDKAAFDEAKVDLETSKDALKELIGKMPGVYGCGLKIHYRQIKSKRWDTKRLSQDHKELEAEYKKEVFSRPFKPYEVGE